MRGGEGWGEGVKGVCGDGWVGVGWGGHIKMWEKDKGDGAGVAAGFETIH